jgi:hypothetical protein
MYACATEQSPQLDGYVRYAFFLLLLLCGHGSYYV